MNIFKKNLAGLMVACAVSGTVWASGANSLALNINDNDLEANIQIESELSRNSKVVYEIGGLGAVDEKDEKNSLAYAGIENIGLTDIKGVILGLGLNVHTSYNNEAEESFSAIALKARAGYVLPLKVKTTVMGIVSYAPESLCLTDNIDRYSDSRLEAEVDVIEGGRIIAGYRTITYGIKDMDDYTFNSSAYAGFKLLF